MTPVGADILAALADGDELVGVWGGVGSGKSWAVAALCLILATTRRGLNPETGEPTEPIDVLVTGRTNGDLKRNLWKAFDLTLGPAGGRFVDAADWHRWEMPNGARITWQYYACHGTAAESSNSLEGFSCHVLISDETAQLPPPFYDHSVERCRLPSVDVVTGRRYPAQVVWISRPTSADGYIREARRRIADGVRGRIVIGRTRDNPHVDPETYLRKLARGRSRAEYLALTQEEPGATYPSKGAIYGAFAPEDWPAGNLVDDSVADRAAPTILSIDPGLHTTSCLWWQVHELAPGSRALVLVDEWHPDRATDVQAIIAEAKARPWRLVEAIIDPAADSRSRLGLDLGTEVSILRRGRDEERADGLGPGLGVPVRASLPPQRVSVRAGVWRVAARICAADGTRSLVVCRRLWESPEHDRGWRHTVQNYAWGPDGSPLKGRAGRDADHCADAGRYTVVHHAWDGPPAPLTAAAARAPAPAVRTRPMRAAALRQR